MRTALLLSLISTGILADKAPDWVRHGRTPDSSYKYYVGRSANSPSEQSGFNEATREAYEQAIRENFGFQTKIQSDAYESTKDVVSTKRVQVLSQDVRVYGFEQIDFYKQDKNGKFDVWVLYRFPLAEISREKARLASAKAETKPEFSEQGSTAAARKGGILEISTKPAGASVIVDGESYGKTPMRMKGVLDPGRHTLQLDHPSYKTVEESFVLVPGKTLTIDKALVPAVVPLSITTEPSNASIVINGQPLGTSPLSDVEVPANKELRIEISHAEANPFSTTFEMAKDDPSAKHFDLPLKNASLLLRTVPPGAEVLIDGQKAGFAPTAPKSLQAGKHEITFQKKGFFNEKRDVILRGGEKRIEEVKLQPNKGSSEPAIWTEMSKPTFSIEPK